MEGLKITPSSSTNRFLGLLKQPDCESTNNSLELTESDVVWSSSSDLSDSTTSTDPNSPSFSHCPTNNNRHDHQFRPSNFGLSAALSDDLPPPLLRRIPSFNPSLSASSAARTIPPVPLQRSGSSSDELTASAGSGGRKFLQSAPVNVPAWPKWKESQGRNLGHFDEDYEEQTEEEMLPPHEIVARSQLTTFSVFEGVGRTLKGRDLRRVRNAVFQKTGFLD